MHYEFLDRGRDPATVGIELHLETGQYPSLREFLEELAQSVQRDFPDLLYSTKWFKGCRLVIPIAMNDAKSAIQTMNTLIAATRTPIQNALDRQGLLAKDV